MSTNDTFTEVFNDATDAENSIPVELAGAGYRLLRRMGGGSVSAVYRAERKNPAGPAAVKVVRGGLYIDESDTKLFDREVQRILDLNHPGIVPIWEVGRVNGKLHFFAMELVKGFPLDDFVRMNKLDMHGRLRLFCDICDVVAYGNGCGVLHRDLRPDNIWIDPDGRPRLIDFGVTQLADTDLDRVTPYMSPEQVAGEPRHIDARSEVYALGVTLYQILTYRFPYRVEDRSPADLAKTIQQEPAAPPGEIDKALQGDLERIMLRAIEKNPDERYQSVASLHEDLDRFIGDRPIAARMPERMYDLRKTAKRHRPLVMSACGILILTVGLFAGDRSKHLSRIATAEAEVATATSDMTAARNRASTLAVQLGDVEKISSQRQVELARAHGAEAEQARIATTFKDQAERDRALATEAQRLLTVEIDHAAKAIETKDAAASVLQQMFAVLGSDYGSPAELTLEAVVDAGVEQILSRLENQPEMFADLMTQAGLAYRTLGNPDEAVRSLRTALEQRVRNLGEHHPDTLESLTNLAFVLFAEQHLAEAEPYCRRAVEAAVAAFGEDDARTLTAIANLASLLRTANHVTEAGALYRRVLDGRRRTLGTDHAKTLGTQGSLARLLHRQGLEPEAERLYVSALEGYGRSIGDDAPIALMLTNDLAYLLECRGRYAEAQSWYQRAREAADRTLPKGHWLFAVAENGLGACLVAAGRYEEAKPLLDASCATLRTTLGGDHDLTKRAQRRVRTVERMLEKSRQEGAVRSESNGPQDLDSTKG